VQTSALFGTKIFGFFENYDVIARISRIESARKFSRQGRGEQSIFRVVLQTSFMDGPIMKISLMFSTFAIRKIF